MAERVMPQSSISKQKPTRRTTITARVRDAVRFMVVEGLNRAEAAEKAGLKDNSLYVALQRPEVCAFRNALFEVVRASAASRSIARVDRLADHSVSDHVKLKANEFLLGLEGHVARTEVRHQHEGLPQGLIIVRVGAPREPVVINGNPVQPNPTGRIQRVGTPRPHPSQVKREVDDE